jgi:hypothetical protein
MKPGSAGLATGSGLKGSTSSGAPGSPSADQGQSLPSSDPSGWESFVPGEDMSEIDAEELREFMSGDVFEVGADPVFKERLRRKLWKIVRSLQGTPPSDDPPGDD